MRQLALTFLTAFVFFACSSAQAEQPLPICSVTTAPNLTGTYTSSGALALQGNISLSCNRNGGPKNRTLYIGIDNGSNGARNLKSGSNLLPYTISTNVTGTPWTSGLTSPSYPLDFNVSDPATLTIPVYFQVAAGYTKPPNIYIDNPVNGTVFADSPNAAKVLASFTFNPTVTIYASCNVANSIGTLTLNYTSFSASPVTNSVPFTFDVTCTNTTPYTLALNTYGGTLLGLNYTLSLSASSATGSGVAQPYTINGSITAGQAGTCSGAPCSATQAHTVIITITY